MQDYPPGGQPADAKPHRSLFERLTALISPEPENRSELLELLHDAHERNLIDADAPSAARVVWKHYGGHDAFPRDWDEMMEAVDKADAAQFSREDILDPQGWELLSFIMDARTGLGRFRDFRISNYQLMMQLIDFCQTHGINEILQLPDVEERVALYLDHQREAKAQIQRCATVYHNLVVLDLRNEETIYAVNRFVIYALYPQCNISIHVMWGVKQQNTVFAIGKSILDRSSNTNVGELCLSYNGGGHANAGTCQLSNEDAEAALRELIAEITADG